MANWNKVNPYKDGVLTRHLKNEWFDSATGHIRWLYQLKNWTMWIVIGMMSYTIYTADVDVKLVALPMKQDNIQSLFQFETSKKTIIFPKKHLVMAGSSPFGDLTFGYHYRFLDFSFSRVYFGSSLNIRKDGRFMIYFSTILNF